MLMERLARVVIRLRVAIIVICLLLTAGAGLLLPGLTADDDVLKFLPDDDPDIQLFHRVNERFGGLDVAIVGLESDRLFAADRLTSLRELTRRIGLVDGVYDVLSFTELPDPRPGPMGLVIEPLVDEVPTDPEALAALRAKVLANKNAVGNLVSPDGRAAMILCFLGGQRPATHTAADIEKAARSVWTKDPIVFGGAPFIRLHVAGGTKADLDRLTPIVGIVVTLVTFFIFRKPLGVGLALGVVGMTISWLLAIFVLAGRGMTVVDSSLTTLMMAIGGAYGIHVLGAYYAGRASTVRERIVETLRQVGGPVAASAATTCAGFISFQVMNLAPMRTYGLIAALGVAVMGLLALTLIPAVLSFSRAVPPPMPTERLSRPLKMVGTWATEHRVLALVLAAVIGGISLAGIARIAPDATLKTFFKDGSPPDLANRFLTRHFGGSLYVQIYFEGDMRSPHALAELRKIVEYAEGHPGVVQVNSLIDPLVVVAEAMGGRPDLPETKAKTQSLYPFLDGNAAFDQLITPEKDAGLIQIRLKEAGPEAVAGVLDDLRRFVGEEIPDGIEIVALDKLDRAALAARQAELRTAVARRILRLAARERRGADPAVEGRVTAVLDRSMAESAIAPGPDLVRVVRGLVEEHVIGEATPLEEPLTDELPPGIDPTAVAAEWAARGARVELALTGLAGQPAPRPLVQAALRQALPLLATLDPEGLELASDALTAGLTRVQTLVRAERLAAEALIAAGVASPSAGLKSRVAVALTDLDAREFGFAAGPGGGHPVAARVTGQPVVNIVMSDASTENQLKSLSVTLAILFAILAVTFRSLGTALKGMIPALFMLCLSVGVMGLAAIPLDMTTTMISAIASGIGVDYAIHFLWRRRRRGESLAETTATVGPSIAANAVQVAAGFLVLAISEQVPMQRFGLLVAMTMILCAFATFVLLPALRAEGLASTNSDAPAPDTSLPPITTG